MQIFRVVIGSTRTHEFRVYEPWLAEDAAEAAEEAAGIPWDREADWHLIEVVRVRLPA